MHLKEKNFSVNIGKAVGNEFEEHLLNAKKRMWITTPYLSEKYARLLLKKKEEGLDVRLVTTTTYQINKRALKLLIEPHKEKKEKEYRFYSWLMLLSIPLILLYGLGVLLLLLFWQLRSKKGFHYLMTSPIDLKVYKTSYDDRESNNELIHVKSYVIDDKYFLGSVNLTDKGLWGNVESLIELKTKKALEEGISEFKTLFNHPLLDEKRLDKLGLLVKGGKMEVAFESEANLKKIQTHLIEKEEKRQKNYFRLIMKIYIVFAVILFPISILLLAFLQDKGMLNIRNDVMMSLVLFMLLQLFFVGAGAGLFQQIRRRKKKHHKKRYW